MFFYIILHNRLFEIRSLVFKIVDHIKGTGKMIK